MLCFLCELLCSKTNHIETKDAEISSRTNPLRSSILCVKIRRDFTFYSLKRRVAKDIEVLNQLLCFSGENFQDSQNKEHSETNHCKVPDKITQNLVERLF